jgi:hypothetical protein
MIRQALTLIFLAAMSKFVTVLNNGYYTVHLMIDKVGHGMTRSMQDELVEDLITIVTSFSGRVHGMRGSHGKHVAGSNVKADPCARAMDKAVSKAIDAAIEASVKVIVRRSKIQRSVSGKKCRGARTC